MCVLFVKISALKSNHAQISCQADKGNDPLQNKHLKIQHGLVSLTVKMFCEPQSSAFGWLFSQVLQTFNACREQEMLRKIQTKLGILGFHVLSRLSGLWQIAINKKPATFHDIESILKNVTKNLVALNAYSFHSLIPCFFLL